MCSKPLFSMIVPAFNVREFLVTCIESIESQTFTDFEVILIDDGSVDGTSALCDSMHDIYPNLKCIHQKNLGPSAARNRGIEMAEGEYCMFVDSDDLICKNSLDRLARYLNEDPDTDVAVTRRMTYDSAADTIQECRYVFQEAEMLCHTNAQNYRKLWNMPDCWLGPWIFCVRTAYLRKNGLLFYEGILHEDEEWIPRMFLNAGRIRFLNIPVYCNRIHRTGSITSTPDIKRMFDKFLIIELLQTEFGGNKYTEEIKETVKLRTQMLFTGILSEINVYEGETGFEELLQIGKSTCSILRDSERKLYRIVYRAIRMFGIRFVSAILFRAKHMRGISV